MTSSFIQPIQLKWQEFSPYEQHLMEDASKSVAKVCVCAAVVFALPFIATLLYPICGLVLTAACCECAQAVYKIASHTIKLPSFLQTQEMGAEKEEEKEEELFC